jgi:hypothetical protein
MAQQTLERPTGRTIDLVAPFRARRAGDRDPSRRRPVLTFRRSTWSAYLERQMFGDEWAARRDD